MTTLFDCHHVVPLAAPRRPYALLYQAVIVRALQDLECKQHRDKAREWLLSSESDHAFSTAGISPSGIRQKIETEKENDVLN